MSGEATYRHSRTVELAPLPPGWRIVVEEAAAESPGFSLEQHPIAALALVETWRCSDEECSSSTDCAAPQMRDVELAPVWARGIQYTGDLLVVDDADDYVAILGPGEPFDRRALTDRVRADKERGRQQRHDGNGDSS